MKTGTSVVLSMFEDDENDADMSSMSDIEEDNEISEIEDGVISEEDVKHMNDDDPFSDENLHEYNESIMAETDMDSIRALSERAKYYRKKYCRDHKNYSKEEINELLSDFKSNDEQKKEIAKDKLVMSVTNMIINIARTKFHNYYKDGNFMDIYMQGVIGVMESLNRYDGSTQFTTWCYQNIIHYIQLYVSSELCHTSTHYGSHIHKINSAISEKKARGVEYTADDLRIENDIPLKTLSECFKVMKRNALSESFDSDTGILAETVSSGMDTPEQAMVKKEQIESIYTAMKTLTNQEFAVVALTVGFCEDEEPKSEKDISGITNIPVQYIRGLKSSGLYKIAQYMKSHSDFDEMRKNRQKRAMQPDINLTIPMEDLQKQLKNIIIRTV